jgi:CheY-like chemotaxis protein
LEFGVMKILLAEDNPENQKVFALIIKSLGYSLDIANDGVEALEKIKQEKYDLVLMDVSMPRMDGIEAAKHIMNENLLPPKIIIMTGHAIDKSESVNSGIDLFLQKPFTVAELKKAINNIFVKSK